ncbi:MAG: hypothetical protein ACKO96_21410, partial [Flammeovirgaceae bacterium]
NSFVLSSQSFVLRFNGEFDAAVLLLLIMRGLKKLCISLLLNWLWLTEVVQWRIILHFNDFSPNLRLLLAGSLWKLLLSLSERNLRF